MSVKAFNIRQHLSRGNREPGQLDGKQSHAWFNYDEDDRTKFSAASDAQRCLLRLGSSVFNWTEHLNTIEPVTRAWTQQDWPKSVCSPSEFHKDEVRLVQ
jgi:hypothetical protein